MQFGDILVCIERSDSGRRQMEMALALAARSKARLLGYYPMPRRAATAAAETAMNDAEVAFDRSLRANSLDGQWIAGTAARPDEDIAEYARCADLVVVSLGSPDEPGRDAIDVERLVMECGRPVLGLPIANLPETIGRNILVAWDGSRESARAVNDAMPFLREAKATRIVSVGIDPTVAASAENLVAHLKRLGIAAAVDHSLDLHLPIGEEILSRIEGLEADLLVAGAFGHSRLREHLGGGATLTFLHQMMTPVLVSH